MVRRSDRLKARYPNVLFLGPKHGAELAAAYAAADVFVFPSRTDTFGLVNIEALACGLPVAAFPVAGPLDILGPDKRRAFMADQGRSERSTRIWAMRSTRRFAPMPQCRLLVKRSTTAGRPAPSASSMASPLTASEPIRQAA